MNGNGRWTAIKSLGPVLERYGVTIALEPLNRFETYFLNTASDAVALCDQIGHPNVGILFDTFHANIEEKDIGAGYRTVAKHLKHVHTCENDRGIPGIGSRRMARGVSGFARREVRRLAHDRELRLFVGRTVRGRLHLEGHCSFAREYRF